MAEIPCDDVVNLVDRSESNVDGVGDIFAVKDAAVDVAVGEDRDLFGQFEMFERLDEVKIAGAMWFGHAFEFALY